LSFVLLLVFESDFIRVIPMRENDCNVHVEKGITLPSLARFPIHLLLFEVVKATISRAGTSSGDFGESNGKLVERIGAIRSKCLESRRVDMISRLWVAVFLLI
jgi:hypothetical protein